MNASLDPRLRWQKAVLRDDELSRSVRHVAVVVATHLRLDLTGAAPLVDLMLETGYERSLVLQALSTLRRAGWLHVERARERGRATVYRAEMPALLRRADTVEVHPRGPQEPVEVHPRGPQESDEVHPGAPQDADEVHRGGPLLKKNYVRTLSDQDRPPSEDSRVAEVLSDLAGTRLRPRAGSHVGRLRGLVRQRLAAGVSPAEIAEDARSVTIDPLDPPAMFATAVRREPYIAPAPVARPHWCGTCDERTRLREDDEGRAARCPACHPLAVVV